MKRPSFLAGVHATAQEAVSRFPFVVAFMAAPAYAIAANHIPDLPGSMALGAAIALWLIFATALTVFLERYTENRQVRLGGQIALLIVFLGYYLALQIPDWPKTMNFAQGVTFFLLEGLSWLSIFCAMAYKAHGTFWKQAMDFVTRLLLTVFFGAIIFLLLTIALGSCTFLLKAVIEPKIYVDLWIIIVGIFGPIFMLGGFPGLKKDVPLNTKISGFIEGLATYILFPASLLYFVIVYLYGIRILFTGDWPSGTTGFMLLGFFGLFIASYAVLHRKIEALENSTKWTRILFAFLVPPLLLFYTAIGLRIQDFGLTERRYMLIVAAIALTSIILYFLMSKKRRLEMIPYILSILLVLSAFGPWGILDGTKNSQISNLRSILAEHNMLQNGKVVAAHDKLSDEDSLRAYNILLFLSARDYLKDLQPWFDKDISGKSTQEVFSMMSLTFPRTSESTGQPVFDQTCVLEQERNIQNSNSITTASVRGYDFVLDNISLANEYGDAPQDVALPLDGHNFAIKQAGLTFEIREGANQLGTIDITDFARRILQQYCGSGSQYQTTPKENMQSVYETDRYKAQMDVYFVSGKEKDKTLTYFEARGRLFIHFK